jgi:glucose-6-phosphate isomerase
MKIILDTEYLRGAVESSDFDKILPEVKKAHDALSGRSGRGGDFTGWLDLPGRTSDASLEQLMRLGEEIREHSDCLVSVGIGGSYVGIRATLEFLIADQKIPVYYAGHNLSSGYLYHLLKRIKDQRLTVVVISKSGTTTEPALAFRIIKQFMTEKYSPEELKRRIICITDPHKGALRAIAQKEGYRTYPIDPDVGGRFSVLTHVGLVPLAIAGIDIKGLVEGARRAEQEYAPCDLERNISYRYAAARYLLYKQGKVIEILSTFYQRLSFVEEWWKQLFGESEGKDGKGIFPASCNFTADLHSMGQLIQEGQRNIFETFLRSQDSGYELLIPKDEDDVDNFNCVAGQDLDFVNHQAYAATAAAHFEGGVPNMTISVPAFDAATLGHLYYFFEKAVAVTGYLLGVNPFDQPGVEAYKIKMFALLGRK